MQILNIKKDDKILILAPHPDDECIGAGGIIALYPQQCEIIVLTDGRLGQGMVAPEEEKAIRKSEFIAEMKEAGVKKYQMLDFEDGTLMQHQDCLEAFDFSIYTKIFVTGMQDIHADHTAGYMSVYNALKKQKIHGIELYLYEVHAPLQEPSHMLDITEIIEKKLELIRIHQSQVSYMPYDKLVKVSAEYRALQNRMDNRYIEVYKRIPYGGSVDKVAIELEGKLQKQILFYQVMVKWLEIKMQGKNIAEALLKNGHTKIAVYGYAELGKLLCQELFGREVEVKYILDKKVKGMGEQKIPIYFPGAEFVLTDTVIVTAIYYFDEIKQELEQSGYKYVLSLKNLIEEI